MARRSSKDSRATRFFGLLRNLTFAAVLYALIFGIIFLARNPKSLRGKLGIPASLDKSGPADIIKTTKSGVTIKFAASSSSININPHANVFNRPPSAVQPDDDYLGPRPHVDTEADLQLLVEECRGTELGLEKVRNIFQCLQFLAQNETRYYRLPPEGERASEQNPRKAEYLDSDGHENTDASYLSAAEAKASSKTDIGTCAGPIIPYHSFWTGRATWRLEVFLKSYLYTQNLPCSRLYLWLDEDHDETAVEYMLAKDPIFARFLHFVDRGDIKVMSWKFPTRIPLPRHEANDDGMGYYKYPAKPNSKNETFVADGVVEDAAGMQWLVLTPNQITFLPQYIAEAVRFVVLHLYGGVYLDMDVILLRDMRPLLLPKDHSFAERWAAHSHPGDYNTAVLSLTANSSLSSYLLHGGIRMGLNFHPRVIGRMAWKDGRHKELLMLETAAFDPVWTEYAWEREGRCTVPCLRDFNAVFKGRTGSVKEEWESYSGEPLPRLNLNETHASIQEKDLNSMSTTDDSPEFTVPRYRTRQQRLQTRGVPNLISRTPTDGTAAIAENMSRRNSPAASSHESIDSFSPTGAEEDELRKAGVILDYRLEEDKYPPNNRTLSNFFRGTWAYHLHNQWMKHPEPSSWLSVLEHAHNGFFAGTRTNMYGENWTGPPLLPYNYWPEFI